MLWFQQIIYPRGVKRKINNMWANVSKQKCSVIDLDSAGINNNTSYWPGNPAEELSLSEEEKYKEYWRNSARNLGYTVSDNHSSNFICKGCGALVKQSKCEYCGTLYIQQPSKEKKESTIITGTIKYIISGNMNNVDFVYSTSGINYPIKKIKGDMNNIEIPVCSIVGIYISGDMNNITIHKNVKVAYITNKGDMNNISR